MSARGAAFERASTTGVSSVAVPRIGFPALARLALVLIVAFFGLQGLYGYVREYVLYRGFGPPAPSVAAPMQGSVVTLPVRSQALGGRVEQALVYLPKAYWAQPQRRFPVVYLLHGTPGDPRTAFVNSLHIAPRMDALIAAHLVRPMVVVMPPGSPATYSRATEWANGPGTRSAWFTYLTRDLVHSVDAQLRTIPNRGARGIGGFSSGADAAVNAILLRPGTYSVAEGWSGDYHQSPGSVGNRPALVARYSAVATAPHRAVALARAGAHVYLYAGHTDHALRNTLSVARALRQAGVRTLLDVTSGGHAWTLWSARLDGALRYFSHHLTTS